MKYDITDKNKTMRYLLCCVVVMSVAISSCHRRSVPESSTTKTEDTKPVTPVYTHPVIIVDARGNFAVTEATLPTDASKDILNPVNARAYTPAQTKTMAYRFGKVPPRILYVPVSLQKKSARGTYYVLDKKFWYWRKSNGYFYIDENYFK